MLARGQDRLPLATAQTPIASRPVAPMLPRLYRPVRFRPSPRATFTQAAKTSRTKTMHTPGTTKRRNSLWNDVSF